MLIRIYHYSYLLVLRIVAVYLRLYFIVKPVHSNAKQKDAVLALPSYADGWPGGLERFANWKPYFEEAGIRYSISWSCSTPEYTKVVDRNLDLKKWFFHMRLLLRRVKVLKTISDYSTIYIQRELIPLYDTRYTGIDGLVIKSHPNVVYDFYDADYESTPKLTFFIFNHAKKITVASRFLESLVQQTCNKVFFTRICLPVPAQIEKVSDPAIIRIGWMGSPGNAKNLIELHDTFAALKEGNPEIEFSFVCRKPPDVNFKGIVWNDMNDPDFDYSAWLTTLDIGIVPYLEYTARTKAKTAMKSLEFWANSVAVVCSPYGMSDKIESAVNCLIANDSSEWYGKIATLIVDKEYRQEISTNGYQTFLQYHTYSTNFKDLKRFLLHS